MHLQARISLVEKAEWFIGKTKYGDFICIGGQKIWLSGKQASMLIALLHKLLLDELCKNGGLHENSQ